MVADINVTKIYDENKTKLDFIVAQKDYNELIKVYNRKNLHKRVSKEFFDLINEGYANLVLRLLKTDKKDEIITELKKFVPAMI